MRRRPFGHNGNGKAVDSVGELRFLRQGVLRQSPVRLPMSLTLLAADTGVADAERHLSDQQLVDFVIGTSSRTGKLSARHHLATCSLCREDLENVRGVDRQLELEGGGRRLTAIPRAGETPWVESAQPVPPPLAARGRGEVAVAMTTSRRWRRVVVPLMAAVCTIFAVKVAIKISPASSLTQDQNIEVAGSMAETSRPRGHASDMEAPSSPDDVEAAVVEVSSAAVTSRERIDDPLGTSLDIRAPSVMSPGVSVAASRGARTPPEPRYVDTISLVARERHPGAGRVNDRVSPPPRELGV